MFHLQSFCEIGNNHSILVSGESGAGKTESTKIMMESLVTMAGGNNATVSKVLKTNHLLESFGNAQVSSPLYIN